ncbi:unnamed protein product [Larinioides sclopetarius]|uniref:Uncharacterized protein n=1 Tax=Larinioides sclopetarius TaxID=280406 RepID=A0AAV1ZFV5_9ARAC
MAYFVRRTLIHLGDNGCQLFQSIYVLKFYNISMTLLLLDI